MIKAFQEFQQFYRKPFIHFAILFVVVGCATYVGLLLSGIEPQAIMKKIVDMLGGEQKLNEMSTQSNHETFMTIFLNNWGVCFKLLLFAFIPLPIYLGIFFVNAAMMGMMAFIMQAAGESIWRGFVFGILPHGIFELPAIILAIVVAMKINNSMYKLIFSGFQNKSVKEEAKRAVAQFIFFLTPAMLIAGLLESYVTPLLIAWGYK